MPWSAAFDRSPSALLARWTQQSPARCQVCGRWPAQPVCEACLARWAPSVKRCPRCAHRLTLDNGPCAHCSPSSPEACLRTLVAVVDYDYPWDQIIARFKFRDEPGWAGPLARLMLHSPEVTALIQNSERVLPIPITRERLAQRGYNQAWELIKALRRRLPMPPCLPGGLLRTGQAPDQHDLPRAQRLNNLTTSFWAHPDAIPQLRQRHVLLVDDVCTTGTTLHRAAQALHQAGAARVSALVLARTLDESPP